MGDPAKDKNGCAQHEPAAQGEKNHAQGFFQSRFRRRERVHPSGRRRISARRRPNAFANLLPVRFAV